MLKWVYKFRALKVLVHQTQSLIKIRRLMKNSVSQSQILDTVTLILVFGSLGLAVIDPSTRPAFGDLTKGVLVTYLGRLYIPTPNKRGNQR